MSADDRITGSSKTRYTFRTSNNFAMETFLVADQIKALGLETVYGVAADVGTTRDGWGHRDPPRSLLIQPAGGVLSAVGRSFLSALRSQLQRDEERIHAQLHAG